MRIAWNSSFQISVDRKLVRRLFLTLEKSRKFLRSTDCILDTCKLLLTEMDLIIVSSSLTFSRSSFKIFLLTFSNDCLSLTCLPVSDLANITTYFIIFMALKLLTSLSTKVDFLPKKILEHMICFETAK